MSPRKSSTSSASPSIRSRYLGVELGGAISSPPRRWWHDTLTDRLARARPAQPAEIHLIRVEANRAIVEVDHRTAPVARTAWNVEPSGEGAEAYSLRTQRTWGTLRGAKAWLRRSSSRRRSG